MLKLISWNVNGLRACIKKGFFDFFYKEDADFFCVQETKMKPEQADFEFNGYHSYWNSAETKGYSGTLIVAKNEPLSVIRGIDGLHCNEGRLIVLEYNDYYVATSYSPNAQPELKRIEYRMQYEEDMRMYLSNLSNDKPVILCGDLNVAHKEIDLKNAKSNIGNPGFSYEERGCFSALLNSGFTDTYRHLYPDRTDAYTWWSYRANARANNVGWRIDYFLVSDAIRDKIDDASIYPDVFGSDHCPIGLTLRL
ncbi:MAG: exodeoxyribonuclease III [Ruminococcaceae bacterium]|nr:exodeoxyribonuclease III [Oscillospiraceae bacterium]